MLGSRVLSVVTSGMEEGTRRKHIVCSDVLFIRSEEFDNSSPRSHAVSLFGRCGFIFRTCVPHVVEIHGDVNLGLR